MRAVLADGPAPHSGMLVRMVPLALCAQFLFRCFRHDGGRDAGTLALQQPFTGFLTCRKVEPIGTFDACIHPSQDKDDLPPPVPTSYG
jgi:hypothetical protein